MAELSGLVEPIARDGNLELEVRMEHEREPFETPMNDPAVQAVAAAHRSVTGEEPEFVGERIVGDANLYVAGTGIPTFYYGPSNETAHSDFEWVSIDRVASAAAVYAEAAARYCGVAEMGS
ncbi:MAG: M20/M25/M40 family metallo-hydrolase [Thermomicrobiales bacterium]